MLNNENFRIPHAQPNGGTETTWESVPDYFFRTYRKQLQNTRLPAVIPAGRPGERHPAEMLRILPGQKIPLEKQSAELSAELMKVGLGKARALVLSSKICFRILGPKLSIFICIFLLK